jgi:DNA-binding transcriptional LysR family regulator
MINNIDSSKIRILQAVAESHSVTAAARKLHLTPPAVSQSIKVLEKHIGQQLFVRIGKKLKPTDFTLAFCKISESYLESVNQLLASNSDARLHGKLRIGAVPNFGSQWLTPKVVQFLFQHKTSLISLNLMDTKLLINDLLDHKIDLAFLDDGSHLDEFSQFHINSIYTEELVMCCSQIFYKKELREETSFKALTDVQHIPYHEGKEAVYKWYQHHYGKSPKIKFNLTVDTAQGVLSAIKCSAGLGVIPKSILVQKNDLVIIQEKKSPLKSSIVSCQLKDKIPSKLEKHFLNFLV